MDGQKPPLISPRDFHEVICARAVIDGVCRSAAFDAVDRMLAGALRRAPDEMGRWVREVPTGHPFAVYHDAFHAWCRSLQGESPNRVPVTHA